MSLPVWTTATAYALGARVTPTVLTGRVWQASVAGTSGGAEPTWPVTEPWTVVDGTVTWGLASSLRQNAVAAAVATLTSFRTANPTLLRGIATARPRNLTQFDMPGAYVADRDETMVMGAGLRTRTLAGFGVVAVDLVPDNAEAEARMDILIDGLVDAFTAAYHAIDGYSILQPLSVSAIDPDPEGGAAHVGELISLGATFKTEGRQ